MMAVGGTLGLTPRFSASQFWDHVRATGSTYTTLLGGMVDFILTLDPREDDRDNTMRFLSAAPYPVHWQPFEERFDVKVTIAYGLSDHSVPTRLPMDPPPSKRGSCGPVIDGFEMAIFDEDDMPLPPGQIGEAVIRAQWPWHSSAGYYKAPEQTLESRRNEWFHTGDRGYLDEDGYFWFVDRAKDAIRRLGENISSWEVEKFASRCEFIAEIAAYPVKAETSEDEVAVSIVAKPGQPFDPREFIHFCLAEMPKHMVPRFVHVADSLPRNLNQRVEKYKLRELLESDRTVAWDRENDAEFRRPARKGKA
jgi:crotonobetaine/carnitine-CoA ligase